MSCVTNHMPCDTCYVLCYVSCITNQVSCIKWYVLFYERCDIFCVYYMLCVVLLVICYMFFFNVLHDVLCYEVVYVMNYKSYVVISCYVCYAL